jgi:ABC-type amino acid transport substrate-binding protein
MVDALATAMGRKAEFVPSDWETLVSALQRKSFDVIVNGLEPRPIGRSRFNSEALLRFQLALTVRKDDERIHCSLIANKVVGTWEITARRRCKRRRAVQELC